MNRFNRWLAAAALGTMLLPGQLFAAVAAKPAAAAMTAKKAPTVQKILINGRWVKAKTMKSRAITNPANEKILGHIAEAGKPDVDRAVGAAKAAFAGWKTKLPSERGDAMLEISKKLTANKEEIAKMISQETGKPYAEAYDEVGGTAAAFDYYGNLVKGKAGEVAAPMSRDQINYATREPYGVVAAIVPFNFPLLLTAWKIAPALAAGNTVVIKPPHQNPLSNLLMAKLFDGLPKGVVNVVTGAGETGALLTAHPDVRVVAFTGSSAVGAKIAQEAGKGLKKVHLELGGMDPAVVFADADIESAVKELAWSRGLNAGQVCTSPKRIIVDEKIADQFIGKLVERVKAVRVGDPLDPKTDMGPMVSKEARAALQHQLDKTLAEGGELLYQAKAPEGQKGSFFMPAVVKVKEGMTAAKEEMFGPVYTILVAKNADDAIRIANSTEYALGASAFTTSQALTHRARTELVGGTVWINRTQDNSLGLSFGGPYQSGGGQELGPGGLESFTWNKTVIESTTAGTARSDGWPYADRKIPGARKASKTPAIEASRE
jgi:betaine-aldehyde dehydrogenase